MEASNSHSKTTSVELINTFSQSPSRLSKRFRSEFRNSQAFQEGIIDLSPVDDNTDLQHWKAMIKGPKGTSYENGTFTLDIHCSSNYPLTPPKIIFQTKIFHPNISSQGHICLDILQNHWSPVLSLEKTLLSISALLSDPNIDDFLVPEAAFLYKENRKEFNRKAREWTQKYAIANNETIKRHEDSNELDNITGAMGRMNVSSSSASSSHMVQKKIIKNKPSGECRPARFNVVEALQAKTFDNGESKEYVPIIARCLKTQDNHPETNRHQMDHLDNDENQLNVGKELQLFMLAIEKEGRKLGKRSESEMLVDELCKLIDLNPEIIGQGCLHLYSMETFLYSQLNEFLREGNDAKIEIYGPFVRLLHFYFDHSSSKEVHSIEVYRGMDLSKSAIKIYEEGRNSNTSFRWAGFSSSSKSRQFAEDFGSNTLFIMQLRKIYMHEKKAIDISDYSQYPSEEEVLLKAGVEFTIEKVHYNDKKGKHYIYLNVYV